MNAIVSSITQSFSCWGTIVSDEMKPKISFTHMCPIERSSLEVRWRALNVDVLVQAHERLLSIATP
jgi:hypothetical protein